MNQNALRPFVTSAIIAAMYCGFAELGLVLAFPRTNISPVWPPSGVALAAGLLFGLPAWPGVLIGAFVANAHSFVVYDQLGGASATIAALLIAIGNTSEAVLGALLLRRKFDAIKLLDRVDNVFAFVSVSAFVCCVSSVVGVAVHCAFGLTQWPSFAQAWVTWWLGDVTGVLFVAPVILMFVVPRRLQWTLFNLLEVPAILAALILYFWFVFVQWGSDPSSHSHEYLIMPLLLWVAFRLGRRATTLTVFIVCGISIWLTVQGLGPYAGASMTASLLSLQTFVALVALTFMVLMASLTERRNAISDLHALAGSLETLVDERTEELRIANEEKNQFLGMAAHDLRSALNAVIGFSDLLATSLREKLEQRQQRMMENIRDSSRYMLSLVENLLDVSTIEAGRLDLDLHPTDVAATVERSVTLNGLMASTKNITLQYRGSGSFVVPLDERRFEQVINNMINNAIKYSSPNSEVEVSVAREGGQVLIRVKDHGVGMSEGTRERLFQPFSKGRSAGTAGERSTGLGLAIAQKIIVRHGGTLSVESVEGEGSTFTVSLPMS